MKRLLMLASLVVLTVVSSGPLLAQSNPQIGTWKLNVAKSKYVNVQGPKSGTRTVEAQGDGAKVTTEGVAGTGAVSLTASRPTLTARIPRSPEWGHRVEKMSLP